MKKEHTDFKKGFTLIEILVVIGIIAILAAIVIIAINPARQFAQARNSQRLSNVNSILNAIGQNIADNKGIFTCNGSAMYFSGTATVISKSAIDVRKCIVPTYISEIGVDPVGGTNTCVDTTAGDCATGSYDTKYTIATTTTGRYVVSAPSAELNATTTVTR
jgi:prepilin-type N-terminal cleavage/methylation domain-containing protein